MNLIIIEPQMAQRIRNMLDMSNLPHQEVAALIRYLDDRMQNPVHMQQGGDNGDEG
jgi:hypothetical protein